MALDTLRTNKLRSSLTILGVSVGVITVIFMVSIIQGLEQSVCRSDRVAWFQHDLCLEV
jgi:putative ABC transport system permease protein